MAMGGLWGSVLMTICMSVPNQEAAFPAVIISEATFVFLYALYSKRIYSLGVHINVKYDGFVQYMPYAALIILMIPISVYLVIIYSPDLIPYYTISSVVGSVFLLLGEAYFYYVLYRKIHFMLDQRPKLKSTLLTQITVAYVFSLIGDFTSITLKFIIPVTDLYVRYLMVSVRILFVIDFYRYIVQDINKGFETGVSLIELEYKDEDENNCGNEIILRGDSHLHIERHIVQSV